jgi:hypothetical protein
MVIAAIVTDASVLGAIHLVARAGAGETGAAVGGATGTGAGTGRGTATAAPARPWARCLAGKDGEPPSIAAITYLDRGRDAAVTLGEVRGWFGRLAPAAVQVWLLEPKDARVGRRISFEVPAERWPAWLSADRSLSVEAQCDELHRALRAHDVGRPRPPELRDATDAMTRSRHDLEFLFPRRAEQYTAMTKLGTVADLTEERFAALVQWIDAPRPEGS